MVTGDDGFATLGDIFSTAPYFFSYKVKERDNYLGSKFKSEISPEWISSGRSI